MTQFAARGILLDIEGTTSSISFVYDVMFPFVRRELDGWLEENWDSDACQAACRQIAIDAGCKDDRRQSHLPQNGESLHPQDISDEVVRLMDDDVKATGLKQLQGLIWESGFTSGEMLAHVYEDVPGALLNWNANGLDVRIYSSGSIAAQKLFFGHTEFGNLLPQFNGHYDTTTGSKKDQASYAAIAHEFDLPAGEIVFLSDVIAELDAARAAGMQTCLCIRPGNKPVEPGHGHPAVSNFAHLEFV